MTEGFGRDPKHPGRFRGLKTLDHDQKKGLALKLRQGGNGGLHRVAGYLVALGVAVLFAGVGGMATDLVAVSVQMPQHPEWIAEHGARNERPSRRGRVAHACGARVRGNPGAESAGGAGTAAAGRLSASA